MQLSSIRYKLILGFLSVALIMGILSGVSKVEQAGASFQAIQHSVETVTGKVQEVSASIEQIVARGKEIDESMSESMNKVRRAALEDASATQQNSASAQEQLATIEEISSPALSLSNLAENLQGIVARFKLDA